MKIKLTGRKRKPVALGSEKPGWTGVVPKSNINNSDSLPQEALLPSSGLDRRSLPQCAFILLSRSEAGERIRSTPNTLASCPRLPS